jgi:hypothetical protein
MATADTSADNDTKATPAGELTNIAQQFREQLVSSLQQGQKLSIEAAKEWVKAISVLAVPDLPKIPGLPVTSDVEAATRYTFDLAADLLKSQRDFAMQLTSVVAPAKAL